MIEISWFDGTWAAVTIQTRYGSRPGDDVTAKLYLRDDDLKSLGVDCTRIVAVKGLPYSFDVEALAAGLFEVPMAPAPAIAELIDEQPDNVVYLREPDVEPAPAPLPYEPEDEPELAEVVLPEPQIAPLVPDLVIVEPLVNAEIAPEAVVADVLLAEPVLETVVAAYTEAEPTAPTPTAFDLTSFIDQLRNGKLPFGKHPLIDIGASVAAVAVPMLAYLLMEFMKSKSPKPDDDKPA